MLCMYCIVSGGWAFKKNHQQLLWVDAAISINWIHRRRFSVCRRVKNRVKSLIKIRFPACIYGILENKAHVQSQTIRIEPFQFVHCANWPVQNFNWKLNVNKPIKISTYLYTGTQTHVCYVVVVGIVLKYDFAGNAWQMKMHSIYLISSRASHIAERVFHICVYWVCAVISDVRPSFTHCENIVYCFDASMQLMLVWCAFVTLWYDVDGDGGGGGAGGGGAGGGSEWYVISAKVYLLTLFWIYFISK